MVTINGSTITITRGDTLDAKVEVFLTDGNSSKFLKLTTVVGV